MTTRRQFLFLLGAATSGIAFAVGRVPTHDSAAIRPPAAADAGDPNAQFRRLARRAAAAQGTIVPHS